MKTPYIIGIAVSVASYFAIAHIGSQSIEARESREAMAMQQRYDAMAKSEECTKAGLLLNDLLLLTFVPRFDLEAYIQSRLVQLKPGDLIAVEVYDTALRNLRIDPLDVPGVRDDFVQRCVNAD